MGGMMSTPTGAIVWQGPSPIDGSPLVAIVTFESANVKTGNMPQLWILRADMPPMDAVRSGADDAICGSCFHRGDPATGRKRSCYVTVWQAPAAVWRTYARGGYPVLSLDEIASMLAGRTVRLGAYGDPAMLPLSVVRAILTYADGWTGYTHQWRAIDPEWSDLLMASADSVTDRRAARALGYRSFYVAPVGAVLSEATGAVECAATRSRAPRQCIDCGMCAGTRNGTTSGAVDIAIVAHGAGARNVA